MNINKNDLKIVIPNKGRLSIKTIELLQTIGLEFETQERSLMSQVKNLPITILYVRASNIPEYVQDGIADLGVTGLDLAKEQAANIVILKKLGYGNADLVVAVPEKSNIKKVSDLKNKNIVTSYPHLTKKYLQSKKIKSNVIEVDGAVEITPFLGLADAITDLTSTGTTLKTNKLIPLDTILKSEAILITNNKSQQEKGSEIDSILTRLDAAITAQKKVYIMMNAPEEKLEEIKKITPGLSSPTIMKLAKEGMVAIHSVIDKNGSWEVVEKLKKIGASGILIMPINKMLM